MGRGEPRQSLFYCSSSSSVSHHLDILSPPPLLVQGSHPSKSLPRQQLLSHHSLTAPDTFKPVLAGWLAGYPRRLVRAGVRGGTRKVSSPSDQTLHGFLAGHVNHCDSSRGWPVRLAVSLRAGTWVLLGEKGRSKSF
jgi:hypothetical protein